MTAPRTYPSPRPVVLPSPKPPRRRPGHFAAEFHPKRNIMSLNCLDRIDCDEGSSENLSTLAFPFHKQVKYTHYKKSAVDISFDCHEQLSLFILVSALNVSSSRDCSYYAFPISYKLWDHRKLLTVSELLFPPL